LASSAPKAALLHMFTTLNYLFAVEPQGVERFAYARPDWNTRSSTVVYKPHSLHRQLEQLEELARDENSAVPVAPNDSSRCATCRSSLAEPYIKCSECLDIVLCLQCFARGKEVSSHRNNHAYIIVRSYISWLKKLFLLTFCNMMMMIMILLLYT